VIKVRLVPQVNQRLFVALASIALIFASPMPSSTAADSVYLSDCGYGYTAKPSKITLTCGDGNVGIEKISWSNWGKNVATGQGTYFYNNCLPYCAAGKFIRFKIAFSVGSTWLESGTKKKVYSQLQIPDSGKHQLADQTYGNLYNLSTKNGKLIGPLLNPGAGSAND